MDYNAAVKTTLDAVSSAFNVSIENIISNIRNREYAECRKAVVCILFNIGMRKCDIAKWLVLTESSIIYLYNKHQDAFKYDKDYRTKFTKAQKLFNSYYNSTANTELKDDEITDSVRHVLDTLLKYHRSGYFNTIDGYQIDIKILRNH